MEGTRAGYARRGRVSQMPLRTRADGEAMRRPLERGGIDLWCVALRDVDAARRWDDYRALLDAGEHARQARLLRRADRRRDLAARALVRTVLSRYLPVAPEAWVFGADAHGRPRIVAPQGLPPIEFNIAHSAERVLLGITAGRALGVDVEYTRRRADTVSLERYFAPAERAALAALPAARRRRRFFELWTLKEAYLKARGLGLRLPLHGCAFECSVPGEVRLALSGAFADAPQRWALAQLTLRERYVLAVCAERREDPPLTLAVREVVPLEWSRLLEPTLARAAGIVAPAAPSAPSGG